MGTGHLLASLGTDGSALGYGRASVFGASQCDQILDPVVVADSVDVVDVLVVTKPAPVRLFPQDAVLGNVARERLGLQRARVVGAIDVDVSLDGVAASDEPRTVGAGGMFVVPLDVKHRVSGERVGRPAAFGRDVRALPAPAQAETMRRSIHRRLLPLSNLTESPSFNGDLGTELVPGDESPGESSAGSVLERLSATTLAHRHTASPREGRIMNLTITESQGGVKRALLIR
jgi:hypothetical protein